MNNTATQTVTEETAWQPPAHDQHTSGISEQVIETVIKKPTTQRATKQSATTQTTPRPAKPLNSPKLTRKQTAFVNHLLDNPKASAAQAAREAYNVTSVTSATSVAHELMTKPDIQLALANQANIALTGMIEVAEYSKKYGRTGTKEGASYASVAVQVYKDTLDRVLGKATQKVESTSKVVTLNIDLTGTVDGRPEV